MKKQIVIFVLCIAMLCCASIGCEPFLSDEKSVDSQEIYNSITKEDVDKAIENPDEFTEEELEYYTSILDPYEYPIGIGGELSWKDISELSVAKLLRFYEMSPDGFTAFYDKVQIGEIGDVKIISNEMYVPAEEVEGFISNRFNINVEDFRTKTGLLDRYETRSNTYPFKIDNGFGGFYNYELLKVEKSGNIWKFYCSHSYPLYYDSEEIFEEDYAVIVIEHSGEDDYKYLCAKGFHEDKLAAIREKFVYPFSEGLPEYKTGYVGFDETVPQENRDSELLSLLYFSARAGQYESTASLNGEQKATAAISALRDIVYSEKYDEYLGDKEAKTEMLRYGAEPEFLPKEWIEKAVKQIWSENTTIEHMDSFDWVYMRDIGVYVPRYMSTNYIHPYIRSITKTENGYTAEVSYIYAGNDIWGEARGYEYSIGADDYTNIFATPEVVELAKEQPIYNVTAEYGDDGKLHLISSTRGWNQSWIKSDLTYAYEESLSSGEISLYVGKNTEIVVSTASFLGVENYLGFESYAVENGSYELVNLERIKRFLENCERGVADTLFTLKSGSPLPLYAVVLRYDGVSIKKDSYYLKDDELVNITSSQLVEVSESETMWFFSSDGEIVDIFPKGELKALPFAEEGSMTTDEIAKKLESVNKYGFKVKHHGEDVVLETDVHRFDYYDQGNLMDYIYISKDLQKIFVVEQVNGHVLTVVK